MTQCESLCLSHERVLHASLNARIITGRNAILARREMLVAMSQRYGQQGAMAHLEYFLSSEESLKKIPHLVLVGAEMGEAGAPEQEAMGALLLHEYRVLGIGTGIFATDDTTGRRTLIAPSSARMMIAKLATEALMQAGARVVLQSFLDVPHEDSPVLTGPFQETNGSTFYATQCREIPSYLPLEDTMDATLGKMGQKTRSNMRYYRRRAEAQLGCTFIEDVQLNEIEFKAFNLQCAYAVKDELAARRYDSLEKVPGMFLCGIRDSEGRWLSLLGGRRFHDMVEIDWQMNREDLPAYSLSTVMRSYFIENEIERGTRKMYIEGGTPHSMRFSFATDTVRDLVVLKRSAVVWLLHTFADRFFPKKNFLAQVLTQGGMEWQRWS